MSKQYRDKKKRIGVQARHKGRHVHKLDDVVPLEQLREELFECTECGEMLCEEQVEFSEVVD